MTSWPPVSSSDRWTTSRPSWLLKKWNWSRRTRMPTSSSRWDHVLHYTPGNFTLTWRSMLRWCFSFTFFFKSELQLPGLICAFCSWTHPLISSPLSAVMPRVITSECSLSGRWDRNWEGFQREGDCWRRRTKSGGYCCGGQRQTKRLWRGLSQGWTGSPCCSGRPQHPQ